MTTFLCALLGSLLPGKAWAQLSASWVNGNTVVPQYVGGTSITNPGTEYHHTQRVNGQPLTDVVGLPQGPGKTFRGQPGDNWFHFSIPTPVFSQGRQMDVLRAMVLYRSDTGVEVDQVCLFDGPNYIGCFSAASAARSHDGTTGRSALIDTVTRWNLGQPHSMLWGLGISVHVNFAVEGNITFNGAGADFQPSR
jgi:hypothetical protein